MIPYKATEDHPLTEDQEIVNKAYSQRRMPAEHIMALIKNHGILHGDFRGSFALIQAAFKMIVHTTAYMLRNSDRGAQIRIQALREAAVGIDAWGTDSYQPWDPQEPWDSDDDQ